MKALRIFVAAAIAAPVSMTFLITSASAAMSEASCQPLSADNLEECCAAENWRDLVLPGDIRFCPKLNENDNDSGRRGDDMTDNGGNNPPPTTGSIPGNPGNDEPVGMAGEQGMTSETDTIGTKGNSN